MSSTLQDASEASSARRQLHGAIAERGVARRKRRVLPRHETCLRCHAEDSRELPLERVIDKTGRRSTASTMLAFAPWKAYSNSL
jgi:hypothetical protein